MNQEFFHEGSVIPSLQIQCEDTQIGEIKVLDEGTRILRFVVSKRQVVNGRDLKRFRTHWPSSSNRAPVAKAGPEAESLGPQRAQIRWIFDYLCESGVEHF